MSVTHGMDTVAALEASSQLARGWEEISALTIRVEDALHSFEWTGGDADRVRDSWATVERPQLTSAARQVADMALLIRQEAQAQDVASGDTAIAADPAGRGTYQPLSGPVPLTDQDLDMTNIKQGQIGDCWFLAGAGAVAHADPDWIRQHIQRNADGSYDVTLYRKGDDGELHPVRVRVEGSTIADGVRDPNGQPNWLSIYEKAAASQLGGDYNSIDGGYAKNALEMVTGRHAETHDDARLQDIRDGIANGRIYSVSTENPDTWNPFDDEVNDARVVPNHAYMIDQVADHDGDGKLEVHVVNPWGPDGDGNVKSGDLWLTEEQFHDSFDSTYSVAGRGR